MRIISPWAFLLLLVGALFASCYTPVDSDGHTIMDLLEYDDIEGSSDEEKRILTKWFDEKVDAEGRRACIEWLQECKVNGCRVMDEFAKVVQDSDLLTEFLDWTNNHLIDDNARGYVRSFLAPYHKTT